MGEFLKILPGIMVEWGTVGLMVAICIGILSVLGWLCHRDNAQEREWRRQDNNAFTVALKELSCVQTRCVEMLIAIKENIRG